MLPSTFTVNLMSSIQFYHEEPKTWQVFSPCQVFAFDRRDCSQVFKSALPSAIRADADQERIALVGL
jgi:hypothetical protein